MTDRTFGTIFAAPASKVEAEDLNPAWYAEAADSGGAALRLISWLDTALPLPAATLNQTIELAEPAYGYPTGTILRAVRDTAGGIPADWAPWVEGDSLAPLVVASARWHNRIDMDGDPDLGDRSVRIEAADAHHLVVNPPLGTSTVSFLNQSGQNWAQAVEAVGTDSGTAAGALLFGDDAIYDIINVPAGQVVLADGETAVFDVVRTEARTPGDNDIVSITPRITLPEPVLEVIDPTVPPAETTDLPQMTVAELGEILARPDGALVSVADYMLAPEASVVSERFAYQNSHNAFDPNLAARASFEGASFESSVFAFATATPVEWLRWDVATSVYDGAATGLQIRANTPEGAWTNVGDLYGQGFGIGDLAFHSFDVAETSEQLELFEGSGNRSLLSKLYAWGVAPRTVPVELTVGDQVEVTWSVPDVDPTDNTYTEFKTETGIFEVADAGSPTTPFVLTPVIQTGGLGYVSVSGKHTTDGLVHFDTDGDRLANPPTKPFQFARVPTGDGSFTGWVSAETGTNTPAVPVAYFDAIESDTLGAGWFGNISDAELLDGSTLVQPVTNPPATLPAVGAMRANAGWAGAVTVVTLPTPSLVDRVWVIGRIPTSPQSPRNFTVELLDAADGVLATQAVVDHPQTISSIDFAATPDVVKVRFTWDTNWGDGAFQALQFLGYGTAFTPAAVEWRPFGGGGENDLTVFRYDWQRTHPTTGRPTSRGELAHVTADDTGWVAYENTEVGFFDAIESNNLFPAFGNTAPVESIIDGTLIRTPATIPPVGIAATGVANSHFVNAPAGRITVVTIAAPTAVDTVYVTSPNSLNEAARNFVVELLDAADGVLATQAVVDHPQSNPMTGIAFPATANVSKVRFRWDTTWGATAMALRFLGYSEPPVLDWHQIAGGGAGATTAYVGATDTIPGVQGEVPPAAAGEQDLVFHGDGTWRDAGPTILQFADFPAARAAGAGFADGDFVVLDDDVNVEGEPARKVVRMVLPDFTGSGDDPSQSTARWSGPMTWRTDSPQVMSDEPVMSDQPVMAG